MKTKAFFTLVTAAILVAVFSAPVVAEDISAQEFYGQLVDFTPPADYSVTSRTREGGLQYGSPTDESDLNGKLTLLVRLMMPEATLQGILDYYTTRYEKNDRITLKKANIGTLGGRPAAIIEYVNKLGASRELHIKDYYVSLASQPKGQSVFAPSVWAGDADRLEKLDRSLQMIRFKDTVDMLGR